MNCAELREWLLEAEPDDLRGSDPVTVAHLASCAECRAIAAELGAATTALRRAYEGIEQHAPPARSPAPGLRRPALLALGMMAAAAAVVFITQGTEKSPAVPPAPPRSPEVSVEVPEGTNAIVFSTPNPNYDVVWFYKGE